METNRIKWSEEMNRRCIKKIEYLLPADSKPAIKANTPISQRTSRRTDMNLDSVRAISVGEMMECQLSRVFE